MTITDITPTMLVPNLASASADQIKVSQIGVIKSEWVKLRTLRSSWLVIAGAIGSLIAAGIAISWSTLGELNDGHHGDFHHFDALRDPLAGFNLAQLFVGVLAILMTAGEYHGGMIRATLGAVPRRLPVLWAKLGVMTLLTQVTMIPAAIITFFVSERILASTTHVGWSSANVPRIVIGTGLYLVVVAIMSIGIGAIIRNIAGAIGALVGILIIVPAITSSLSQVWANRLNKWMPSTAGQAIMSPQSDTTMLAPWRGLGLFLLYALATVTVAAILLRRRDA